MFGLLHFALDLYFAAVLSIAGLAKLDHPKSFTSALRDQYRFPGWSIPIIGNFFPWLEILAAITLLLTEQHSKIIVTTMITILFILFSLLSIRKQTTDSKRSCSCYGRALQQRGLQTDILTVLIQLCLSIVLLLLALFQTPLSWVYYAISAILWVGLCFWLRWQSWKRSRQIIHIKRL